MLAESTRGRRKRQLRRGPLCHLPPGPALPPGSRGDNGGTNRNELWAAFAKRGMGFSATAPPSSTTAGVHEAFDPPNDLQVAPLTGFVSSGPVGGPFGITSLTYSLTNAG